MNTAKNVQLLDQNNNNISPATNIESLYYEYAQDNIIYRQHVYKHFPVYIRYNNIYIDALDVQTFLIKSNEADPLLSAAVSYNEAYRNNSLYTPIVLKNTGGLDISANLSKKYAYNAVIKEPQSQSGVDIYVSSVKQSKLLNTNYYKLDISTYNLSSILFNYATKDWVDLKAAIIDTSIKDQTRYVSKAYDDLILHRSSSSVLNTLVTHDDVGSIPAGTNAATLYRMQMNDILDKILYDEEYPDASGFAVHISTPTKLPITNVENNYIVADVSAGFTYDVLKWDNFGGTVLNAGPSILNGKATFKDGSIFHISSSEKINIRFYVNNDGVTATANQFKRWTVATTELADGTLYTSYGNPIAQTTALARLNGKHFNVYWNNKLIGEGEYSYSSNALAASIPREVFQEMTVDVYSTVGFTNTGSYDFHTDTSVVTDRDLCAEYTTNLKNDVYVWASPGMEVDKVYVMHGGDWHESYKAFTTGYKISDPASGTYGLKVIDASLNYGNGDSTWDVSRHYKIKFK